MADKWTFKWKITFILWHLIMLIVICIYYLISILQWCHLVVPCYRVEKMDAQIWSQAFTRAMRSLWQNQIWDRDFVSTSASVPFCYIGKPEYFMETSQELYFTLHFWIYSQAFENEMNSRKKGFRSLGWKHCWKHLLFKVSLESFSLLISMCAHRKSNPLRRSSLASGI